MLGGMTTATTRADPVLTDDMLARAREVRFTQVAARTAYVVAQLLANVVYGLGWVIGRTWLGMVIVAMSFYYGFRAGAGNPVPPGQPAPGQSQNEPQSR